MTDSIPSEVERKILVKERLRLLSMAFYISGTIGAILVSFLIFHFIFLLVFSHFPQGSFPVQSTQINGRAAQAPFDSQIIFKAFAAVIGIVILTGWCLGGMTIYAGRCIKLRKHRTFVFVMAGINLLFIPYGTILGIMTFCLLNSNECKKEYNSTGQFSIDEAS